MNNSQPASSLNSPRFSNVGTFMRMPKLENTTGADFAIIGIPFDTASSYRTGARFGPTAIRNISAMIKPNNARLEVNVLESLNGGDYGDISIVPGYIEPTYKNIEEGLSEVIDNNVIPISLGGDHSITLPELRAIAKKHGPVALVHYDSHADINDKVFGQKHNHGTPFRRAIEEGLIDPNKSIQIGMRGSIYEADEFKKAEELGFKLIPGHEVRNLGFEQVGKIIRERVGDNKAFFTFDIDFVDPAFAPGTGTPEVGGFTSYETLELIRQTKGINFVGFDIVEVLPAYDHAEITAYMGANVCFEFISILAIQKQKNIR
ncbi:agmatinase [Virgibacillus dakarensis]|nr:agmatinase [Virgibacillus dakarensis]